MTAADGGFLVVWSQFLSTKPLLWVLRAQRIDLQGNGQGPPLTIGTSARFDTSLAFDGKHVFIAHLDQNGQPTLTTVVGTQITTASLASLNLPASVRPDIAWAGRLFIRWSDRLAEIDASGKILAGPITLVPATSVGHLAGESFVVYEDEYLIAQRLDANLKPKDAPTALSKSLLTASLQRLIGALDGGGGIVFYLDQGFRAIALRCSDVSPAPLGPGWCPGNPAPLADGCQDEVCHAVIRFDYPTLAVKGYAIVGAPYQPIDEATAKTLAEATFKKYMSLPPGYVSVDRSYAGIYHVTAPPSDFGGECLIGAESGIVLTAGGVVYMGQGGWWLPTTWKPAADLSCGPTAATAQETHRWQSICSQDGVAATAAYSSDDALRVALRLNVAASYASRGPFSAYAELYAPAVGPCKPNVTEFVVVLSQRRK